MQFVLICRDAPDAFKRRLALRDEHLAEVKRMKAEGTIIDGGAILDDAGRMIGSVVLCEFPDRAHLEAYLEREVYRVGGIWKDIEIMPFRQVAWGQP